MLLWLGAATVVTLLVSSVLLTLFGVELGGSEDGSWLEGFWQSTMRILDPGTMSGDVGWGRRLLALLVTMFGVLIAGTLIGIIAAGVEMRLEAMQRGRSEIVESDHVVILGASPRLAGVVEQLALAGRSRHQNVIVILADREPAELSHEIRDATSDLHGARLVIRWGDPTSVADLDIVALHAARSIIVLAEDDAGDSDAVKSVLAIGVALGGHGAVPVVVELGDAQVAQSLVQACGNTVHPIIPDQAIARVAAYAMRGPGLFQVIQELLDFRGPDLYVRFLPELTGTRFGDAVLAYGSAKPIGVMSADGAVELSPDADLVVDGSTRLVFIADNDQPLVGSPSSAAPTASGVPRPVIREQHLQHVLIVGWNRLARQLVEELDNSAAPGSTVTVVYDPGHLDGDVAVSCRNVALTLTPSEVRTVQLADHHAEPGALTSILLLAYRHSMSAAEADTRTLLNLMVVRRELGVRKIAPTVVVELLDAGNIDLAPTHDSDDFVISDAIASSMIAQLAEMPERRPAFLQLYAGSGTGIGTITPDVLGIAHITTFAAVARNAYARDLIAIGWSRGPEHGNALTLNPYADDSIEFVAGDKIVVIG